MADPALLPPIDLEEGTAGRIMNAARMLLFRHRYSGTTMDELAFALGMSKKTIYTYFPSKDAIVRAIIVATGRTVRRQIEAAIGAEAAFPETFQSVLSIIGSHFGAMDHDFLADLQRHAPQLSREIDTIKDVNIPMVFGRLLQSGIAAGMVREDLDKGFVTAYWLQVIKGIHDPAVLQQTGLTPREAFEKSVDLLFRGLLTDKGRADPENR